MAFFPDKSAPVPQDLPTKYVPRRKRVAPPDWKYKTHPPYNPLKRLVMTNATPEELLATIDS